MLATDSNKRERERVGVCVCVCVCELQRAKNVSRTCKTWKPHSWKAVFCCCCCSCCDLDLLGTKVIAAAAASETTFRSFVSSNLQNKFLFFKKIGPIPASFCLFSSFSHYNFNNWKKHRWCAWDSNLGPHDCRRRRNHGAMAATPTKQVSLSKYFFCRFAVANNLPNSF